MNRCLVYSRVDSDWANKRPVYARSVYHLFYVDSTWVSQGQVGGTWTIARTAGGEYGGSWYSFDFRDVRVTSRIQFATCPHHATHFYEAKIIDWLFENEVERVPRNISMQETALPTWPTPAPKPFAEIAAEWLRDNESLDLGFSIFFLIFLMLVLLVGFMVDDIEKDGITVKTTLEEIKQLLQSPEEAETMRQKQELLRRLHYYKQKDDEEESFAGKVVSICVNVHMWVCLAYIVFENVSGLRDELDRRFIRVSIHGFVVGALCVSYVIVLGESFCFSSEKKFLQDVREVLLVQQARTVIDKMKGLPPQLRMQALYYHLETQPVTLHQTDAWGDSHLTTTACHFRKVTDTVEDFIPLSWVDLSLGDVLEPSQRGVITLFVESIICAQDTETSRRIESRYNRFKQEHYGPDRSDAFVECRLDYQLPGVQKRLLICDNRPPWWMNTKVFYLASILGLTWIYRLCLKMMTSSSTLVLVKQVFVGDTSEA